MNNKSYLIIWKYQVYINSVQTPSDVLKLKSNKYCLRSVSDGKRDESIKIPFP